MEYVIIKRDELYHHGIKGQKWGIRRYQNFDGSYTKAGLERYNSSREKYESSKSNLKSLKGSGDKDAIREARKQVRADRKQMNKDYKHLKQDKLADQGKELYGKGKTITGGESTLALKALGVSIAAAATKYAIQNYTDLDKSILVNKFGAFKMSDLAAASVGIGATVVNAAMAAKQGDTNKKLRAYYGHTSNY